jgi:hypothetical protein
LPFGRSFLKDTVDRRKLAPPDFRLTRPPARAHHLGEVVADDRLIDVILSQPKRLARVANVDELVRPGRNLGHDFHVELDLAGTSAVARQAGREIDGSVGVARRAKIVLREKEVDIVGVVAIQLEDGDGQAGAIARAGDERVQIVGGPQIGCVVPAGRAMTRRLLNQLRCLLQPEGPRYSHIVHPLDPLNLTHEGSRDAWLIGGGEDHPPGVIKVLNLDAERLLDLSDAAVDI